MSAAVKQFHEEEAIGKTYDFQIARRLLRYLRPYLRLLIPALILTLALNLLGILQPLFTEKAIDWYILPRATQGITLFALVFLGVQLVRFVFSYFQVVLLNTIGQYVMFDLRREIYDKLQHQEVAYYDRNPIGRIMARLTADVDALNELLTSGVTDLLGDLVMIVGIIAVMAYKDWRLTLITLLTVPMLFAATTWFRKGARQGYDMVRTRIARIYAFLQEHFSGAQTVQIFSAEAKSVRRFAQIIDEHRGIFVGYHKLRTRRSGGGEFIDFHLQMRGDMPLKDAHDLSDTIVASIKESLPRAHVLIHLEPEEG